MTTPKKPKIVFSDFDGTLTLGTEFIPEAMAVFALLAKNRIPLVVVTGRSKSWAHFLLTHITAIPHVLSEGGAVLSGRDADGILWDRPLIALSEVEKLEKLCDELPVRFPEFPLTADSFGRQCDRAIELTHLRAHPEREKELDSFLTARGVNFSRSSVHLNFWYGDISKYHAVALYLKDYAKLTKDDGVYFGDSMNDQSMFKDFPHSVGVADISEIEDRLTYKPSIILRGEENRGPRGVLSYLEKLLK
jgi:hypothetical protein